MRHPHPPRFSILHSHAVFGEIWPNNRLPSPLGLAPPWKSWIRRWLPVRLRLKISIPYWFIWKSGKKLHKIFLLHLPQRWWSLCQISRTVCNTLLRPNKWNGQTHQEDLDLLQMWQECLSSIMPKDSPSFRNILNKYFVLILICKVILNSFLLSWNLNLS